MREMINEYKIKVRKRERKLLGRSKNRLVNNIKMYLKRKGARGGAVG
jgi:hypothetical protein